MQAIILVLALLAAPTGALAQCGPLGLDEDCESQPISGGEARNYGGAARNYIFAAPNQARARAWYDTHMAAAHERYRNADREGMASKREILRILIQANHPSRHRPEDIRNFEFFVASLEATHGGDLFDGLRSDTLRYLIARREHLADPDPNRKRLEYRAATGQVRWRLDQVYDAMQRWLEGAGGAAHAD